MQATPELSKHARLAVLAAAFLGLLFDGFELGLMPVASRSVVQSLLGASYTEVDSIRWFARFTAALMLGAAVGGSLLGNLGDRIGRAKAMGVSILVYSIFAGLGAWATSCNEMLALRFLVGLGVGGVWPNAVALVAESWPNTARPTVAGILGAESTSASSGCRKSAKSGRSRQIPGAGCSQLRSSPPYSEYWFAHFFRSHPNGSPPAARNANHHHRSANSFAVTCFTSRCLEFYSPRSR
jgi:Major Facilitator Superfamily